VWAAVAVSGLVAGVVLLAVGLGAIWVHHHQPDAGEPPLIIADQTVELPVVRYRGRRRRPGVWVRHATPRRERSRRG
jgi:hypothetical protein